jgi:hypothetical protein
VQPLDVISPFEFSTSDVSHWAILQIAVGLILLLSPIPIRRASKSFRRFITLFHCWRRRIPILDPTSMSLEFLNQPPRMPAHAEHIERLGGHSDRLSVQRPSSQFERHSARLSTRRSGQHDRPKSVIDMEVGVIDAVPRRPGPGKGPTRVSQRRLDFEQHRPRWLQEMIAEAIGIFICSIATFFGMRGLY